MVAFADVVGYCETENLIDEFDDDSDAVRAVLELSYAKIHALVGSMLACLDASLIKRPREPEIRLRVAQVVYTLEASLAFINRHDLNHALWRHERGDYGRVKKFHRDRNDMWSGGDGVYSRYKDRRGKGVCIYTNDRPFVTVVSLVME